MDHNEITNIDELLNSFIDGELDQRHQTEVQRLIKHDEQIAGRLQKLQNCKRLVSSLPYAEAPDGMLEDIKASLEEKKLLVQPAPARPRFDKRQGQRHLLVRRLVAAAAMIGLVAVLAAVIYSIVVPEATTKKSMAADNLLRTSGKYAVQKPQPAVTATAEKPVGQATFAKMEFSGRLELKTSSPSEVVSFINKAIDEYNVPSGERTAAAPSELGQSLALSCSRQNLRSFLADLGAIWNKFDSATLFVGTDRMEGQIAVDAVTPEQIIEIVNRDNFETQIKTAKYFAAMNNMTGLSPGKEVLFAVDKSTPALITIPKPVLTSSEKSVTKLPAGAGAGQKVLLTIVVVGSK
ncbi:MAG: hypothetical protein WAK60_07180 [Sedimentisphaerales bacterium]